MAGLLVSVGGGMAVPVLKNQNAGAAVTVSMTSFSGYTNTHADDGWYLYGPAGSTASLAEAENLVNNTFTPDVSGRYLVILLATETATSTRKRFSVLFEVDSAQSRTDEGGIPAPQERDEYQAEHGWSRSLEHFLNTLRKNLGGRQIHIGIPTGSAVAQGKISEFSLARHANAGANSALAIDNLTELELVLTNTNGTAADIAAVPLALAVEAIAQGDKGVVVVNGIVPWDTAAMTVGDNLFVSDTGTLSTNTGTNTRRVGIVIAVGGNTLGSGTVGAIYFEGDPMMASFMTVLTAGVSTDHAMVRWHQTGGTSIQDSPNGPYGLDAGNFLVGTSTFPTLEPATVTAGFNAGTTLLAVDSNAVITGHLAVEGTIDPTGLSFRAVAANPALTGFTNNTLWQDSGNNYSGTSVPKLMLDGLPMILNGGNDPVGIGTTDPGAHPNEKNDLVVGNTTGHHGITIASGAVGFSTLRFAYDTTANNGEGWIDYANLYKKMRFGTNGLNTRMTIDEDGNVGIGTTDPDAQLHVKNENAGDATLQIETTSAGDPTVTFASQTNRDGIIKFTENGTVAGQLSYSHSDDVFKFIAASSTGVRAQIGEIASYFTSNVGIGTTTPDEKLHIDGSSAKLKISDEANYNGTIMAYTAVGTPHIELKSHGAAAAGGISFRGVSDTQEWAIATNTIATTGLEFIDGANTVVMNLAHGGNVGIGITAPTEALHVVGNIKATGDIIAEGDISFSASPTATETLLDVNTTRSTVGIGITGLTSGGLTATRFEIVDDTAAQQRLSHTEDVIDLAGNLVTAGVFTDFRTMASGQLRVTSTGGRVLIADEGSAATAANAALEVYKTSVDPQLRLSYNQAQRYTDLRTNSDGYFSIVSSHDRIGIGTESPDTVFHIKSSGTNPTLKLEATTTSEVTVLRFENDRVADGDIASLIQSYNNGASPITGIRGLRGSTDIKGNLAFHTSDLERLRIDEDGKVGIGTANPVAKLDVDGSIFVSNLETVGRDDGAATRKANIQFADLGPAPGSPAIVMRDGAQELGRFDSGGLHVTGDLAVGDGLNVSGNALIVGNLTVSGDTISLYTSTVISEDKNIEMGVVSTPSDVTADGGGLTLKGTTDKTITWTSATDAWNFNKGLNVTSGKVGIGNDSPGAHPDEKNDLVIGNTTSHHGMTIASGITAIGTLRFAYDTTANNGEGWIDYHNTSKKMRFGTDGLNTRMTIDSAGDVGIGISSPTSKLHVAGDVKVDGGDLVFGNAQHAVVDVEDVSGTDAVGKNLTLLAGAGTGAGVGGYFFIKTAGPATTSGSGVNSHNTVMTITPGTSGAVGATSFYSNNVSCRPAYGQATFLARSAVGESAILQLTADNASSAGDQWWLYAQTDQSLVFKNDITTQGTTAAQFSYVPHATATSGYLKTEGNVRVGGNEIQASNGTAALTLDTTGNVVAKAGLTVTGDLTVNGTTTTVNSATLTVDDKNIELGSVATPTDASANGGGITLKGTTDKTILWSNATDSWDFNQGVNVTSGNVGIGTTTPGTLLQVGENLSAVDTPQIQLNDHASYHGEIGYSEAGDTEMYFANTFSAGTSRMAFRVGGNTSANEKVSILGSGNVGIGTTAPDAKLHVNGKTHLAGAQAIKITNIANPTYDASAYPYGATSSDYMIVADVQQGTIQINLETAATAGVGRKIIVKDQTGDAGTNAITIRANGNETIDNGNGGSGVSFTLSVGYSAATLISDGSSHWYIV